MAEIQSDSAQAHLKFSDIEKKIDTFEPLANSTKQPSQYLLNSIF